MKVYRCASSSLAEIPLMLCMARILSVHTHDVTGISVSDLSISLSVFNCLSVFRVCY